jgi:small subunit ribosomal protein S16
MLRLARHGQKKRPFYRVVAAEKQCWRDGRFLQIVGNYNPMTSPASVTLHEEQVRKWVADGAQPTPVVASLIKKAYPGLLEEREHGKSVLQSGLQPRDMRRYAL